MKYLRRDSHKFRTGRLFPLFRVVGLFVAIGVGLGGLVVGAAAAPLVGVVPGAPSLVGAVAGVGTVAVSFVAPVDNGGLPIKKYVAVCQSLNGGVTKTASGAGSPLIVKKLSSAKSYSCTVAANNARGASLASVSSVAATTAGPPQAPTVVGVTSGVGQIVVAFDAPLFDGGSPVSKYTMVCLSSNGGAKKKVSGVASPLTVTGLKPAKAYSCSVAAKNVLGVGVGSAVSASVVTAGPPTAPTIAGFVASAGQIVLSLAAPVDNGGSPVTGYSATCVSSDGGPKKSATGAGSQLVVVGLKIGKTYSCTATAKNALGKGAASGTSPSILIPATGIVAPPTTSTTTTTTTTSPLLHPAPVVTAVYPAGAANGWYRSPVTITWLVDGPAATVPAAVTMSGEGVALHAVSGQSCDIYNQCSNGSATVSIDQSAPILSLANPVVLQSDPLDGVLFTGLSGFAADSLSGIDSESCSVPTGTRLGHGYRDITCTATDLAGNTASITTRLLIVGSTVTLAGLGDASYSAVPQGNESRQFVTADGSSTVIPMFFPNGLATVSEYNFATGARTPIGVGDDGIERPYASMVTARGRPASDNGRFVAFFSPYNGLDAQAPSADWHVFVRDVVLGDTFAVTVPLLSGVSGVSDDGQKVLFESGSPGVVANQLGAAWNNGTAYQSTYVWNRATNTVIELDPGITNVWGQTPTSGIEVSAGASSSDLTRIVLTTRGRGTRVVEPGSGRTAEIPINAVEGFLVGLSRNGRWLTAATTRSFDPADRGTGQDIYRFDADSLLSGGDGAPVLVSERPIPRLADPSGTCSFVNVIQTCHGADGWSQVSDDGNTVAFETSAGMDEARDFSVPGTSHVSDVYLRNVLEGTTTLISHDPTHGLYANTQTQLIGMSSDGRHAVMLNGFGGTFPNSTYLTRVLPPKVLHAPTVSAITPNSGSTIGGTVVTITGTGFAEATAVMFGVSTATTFTIVSDTQISATSPSSSAGVTDVIVAAAGGLSASTLSDNFEFVAPTTSTVIASDAGPNARAGSAVATSGNTFVVGAPGNGASHSQPGAAYVYERDANGVLLETKLIASDPYPSAQFGSSVAISGGTVVVGSPEDLGGAGAAYVFVRSGSNWVQQAKLIASDRLFGLTPNVGFGWSVAIDGDTIVVGAPIRGEYAGSYVFIRSVAGWSQQAKLVASGPILDIKFGISVAILGDTIVVGSLGDSQNQAAVFVFQRITTVWAETSKLISVGYSLPEQFGRSVAISGDTIVVGAQDFQNFGAAYVFQRVQGVWIQQQRLVASPVSYSSQFGGSVAISGDTIVVGSPLSDTATGAVLIFQRLGADWVQLPLLGAASPAQYAYFGQSVAIAGGTIVVGAFGANNFAGNADVFTGLVANP